jgi:hypothetical protein
MTQTKNNLSAFYWQGPSKVIDQFGRIKSERQHLLDATRVNQYSDVARSTDSTKSQRISKAAI